MIDNQNRLKNLHLLYCAKRNIRCVQAWKGTCPGDVLSCYFTSKIKFHFFGDMYILPQYLDGVMSNVPLTKEITHRYAWQGWNRQVGSVCQKVWVSHWYIGILQVLQVLCRWCQCRRVPHDRMANRGCKQAWQLAELKKCPEFSWS